MRRWNLSPSTMSRSQREAIVAAQLQAIAALPAIARAQCRSAPSALSLPGTPVAICFAAGLAHAA